MNHFDSRRKLKRTSCSTVDRNRKENEVSIEREIYALDNNSLLDNLNLFQ